MPNLEELIDAAKAENWDFVDEIIAGLANNPEVVGWALGKGLDDPDGNIRDLAASVLERSSITLPEPVKGKLLELMAGDKNPYAQYRSAFALYVRGDRSTKVVAKIREAEQDPATADIAEKYLAGE